METKSLDFLGYSSYQVTDTGLIIGPTRILAQSVTPKGYLQVTLRNIEGRRNFEVHRLVALAFIPNPDNLPMVNHKDANKQNCTVDNLEWCTYEYNIHHANAMGRNPTSKLCIEDVIWIRENYGKEWTMQKIATKFNIGVATVSNILKRKIWKGV